MWADSKVNPGVSPGEQTVVNVALINLHVQRRIDLTLESQPGKAIDPGRLFDACIWEASGKLAGVEHAPHRHHGAHDRGHDARIACFALIRDEPIPAVALTLFLEVLAEHCGADLLRVKGIVAIAESPERPAVIHGVQHVFHAPGFLDRWPSEDRRSRLVFIARDLPHAFAEALLDAIEAEVRETAGSA